MPMVTINDEVIEAEIGETLLAVARRNVSHIGFACDGRGMCQTCECYVLEGNENLSAANSVERSWQSEAQIEHGIRLACQASIRSDGPIKVLTRAEELRRQTMAIFSPPAGTTVGENLGRLLNNIVRVNLRHIQYFPFNVISTAPQLIRMPPYISGIQSYIADTLRITNRVATGSTPTEHATPVHVEIASYDE